MAFIAIDTRNNQIDKAALNQADYDTFNLDPSVFNKVTISDDDFNGLMADTKMVESNTADSVVIVDQDHKKIGGDDGAKVDETWDQTNFENWIATDLENAKTFIDRATGKDHREHWVPRYQAYITTLESFDASTVSYPSSKSLYEVFDEQSLSFVNTTYQLF